MRIPKILIYFIFFASMIAFTELTLAQKHSSKRIVIAAGTMLDGKGHVLSNTRIVIEGGKIVGVEPMNGPNTGPVDFDLRGLTVMPGWIDSHVHIAWIFGKDGKNGGAGWTPEEAAYQVASNAWVTLLAGFTTVPSVGAPADGPLRAAGGQGKMPGPRILTANEPIMGRGEQTGTPEEIRAFVRT